MRGLFITLEGLEGSGKSTHAPRLAEHLRASGLSVLQTREPGGTTIGDQIRRMLLDDRHRNMKPVTEMLLFAASRAQFVREVVEPTLARGITVVSDRYVDASLAYQGFGRGIDREVVRQVNDVATGGLLPELTLLLDIEPSIGLGRVRVAQREEGMKQVPLAEASWWPIPADRGDRLEQEKRAFYERVRAGFLQLARESPQRFVVIDAMGDFESVHQHIMRAVERFLAERRVTS